MFRKIKRYIILFCVILAIVGLVVMGVMGALEALKDKYFSWLNKSTGGISAFKNETEAFKAWLEQQADKDIDFKNFAVHKSKFPLYFEAEESTYFNDIVAHGHTMRFYNETFQYKVPWQLYLSLDYCMKSSEKADDTNFKMINSLFTTKYYGLTHGGEQITEVTPELDFKWWKTIVTVTEETGTDDEGNTYTYTVTTVEEYPLPYFTRIVTPLTTYLFEYEMQTETYSSGNTTTTITQPVLVNKQEINTVRSFVSKLRTLGLKNEDIKTLVEMISHLPYGDDIALNLLASGLGEYANISIDDVDTGDLPPGELPPGNVVISDGIFLWPVPNSSRITSPFGYRIHPVTKKKKFHKGIDVGGGTGLSIVSTGDGVIDLVSYDADGYGKWIQVNHGNGITSRYAHLSSQNVTKGQRVAKGQQIGRMGSTGLSTGPHLHFEIRINNTPQNPEKYVGVKR